MLIRATLLLLTLAPLLADDPATSAPEGPKTRWRSLHAN